MAPQDLMKCSVLCQILWSFFSPYLNDQIWRLWTRKPKVSKTIPLHSTLFVADVALLEEVTDLRWRKRCQLLNLSVGHINYSLTSKAITSVIPLPKLILVLRLSLTFLLAKLGSTAQSYNHYSSTSNPVCDHSCPRSH